MADTEQKKADRLKAETLNNSKLLDVNRVSDHPEVKAAINQVFSEMVDAGLVSKRYRKKWRDHTRVILLALYVRYNADSKMYTAYSRNDTDYRPGTRNHNMRLSLRHTTGVIDYLKDNGYIEDVRGFRGADKSRVSRMKATQKLIDVFNGHKVEPYHIKQKKHQLIVLRDFKKKVPGKKEPVAEEIPFEPDDNTRQMEANLQIINAALSNKPILLYIKDIELDDLIKKLRGTEGKAPPDFTQVQLHRVFNNRSFEKGGRFVGGWWQNIPKEYRKFIRIDDKDVVECDFSGMHMNIAYSLEGIPMPEGDPYHLEGYSNDEICRTFIKRLTLVMINANNRSTARGAIYSDVYPDKKDKEKLELPAEVKSTKQVDLYPVMDAIEKKHYPIKNYFCSGKGIEFMYLDSQIAEKVMLHFVQWRYAILPMHDSFIIHNGLEDELTEQMEKAYREVMGQDCAVDLKYSSIRERQKQSSDPQGPCDLSLHELFKAQSEYSTYFKWLDGLRETSSSKATEIESPDDDPPVLS